MRTVFTGQEFVGSITILQWKGGIKLLFHFITFNRRDVRTVCSNQGLSALNDWNVGRNLSINFISVNNHSHKYTKRRMYMCVYEGRTDLVRIVETVKSTRV